MNDSYNEDKLDKDIASEDKKSPAEVPPHMKRKTDKSAEKTRKGDEPVWNSAVKGEENK